MGANKGDVVPVSFGRELTAEEARDERFAAAEERLARLSVEADGLRARAAEHTRTLQDLHGVFEFLNDRPFDVVAAVRGLYSAHEALLKERNDLRAAVAGSETPPTDAEIAAHNGPWLVRREDGYLAVLDVDDARRAAHAAAPRTVRWWRLTAEGEVCAR